MKRTLLSILIAALMFLGLHRPASAMVEFCPARLNYAKAGPGLYGFDLSAASARTITESTLTFDTSSGWYNVSVPSIELTEKDRRYSGPSSTFVRRDFVSPVLYVRFPQAITVNHGWVSSASGKNCDPAARRMRIIQVASVDMTASDYFADGLYRVNPRDADPLSASPQAASVVLKAATATPSLTANCAKAFEPALVSQVVRGQFPDASYSGRVVTTVEIALDANGKLANAQIWGPSGIPDFDKASLQSATGSRYTGARAYCKPAPATYLFRVEYDP